MKLQTAIEKAMAGVIEQKKSAPVYSLIVNHETKKNIFLVTNSEDLPEIKKSQGWLKTIYT